MTAMNVRLFLYRHAICLPCEMPETSSLLLSICDEYVLSRRIHTQWRGLHNAYCCQLAVITDSTLCFTDVRCYQRFYHDVTRVKKINTPSSNWGDIMYVYEYSRLLYILYFENCSKIWRVLSNGVSISYDYSLQVKTKRVYSDIWL